MGQTTIEWTEATWNPARGCSPISPGCKNCYAEHMAGRFCKEGKPFHGFVQIGKNGNSGPHWTGKVELIPEMLDVPLRRRKPTTFFVNSMSDLFHENLPDEAIDRVFAVMALCPQHTFQVLTKRADRMREYLTNDGNEDDESMRDRMDDAADALGVGACHANMYLPERWPLPNVWLGVSVEDQQRADERIPVLLQTPAAMRFVSAEPLLGPVDLDLPRCEAHDREFAYMDEELRCECCSECRADGAIGEMPYGHWLDPLNGGIDWVIVGGESGPGARPMHPEWVRSLRDQCNAAGVAFFFKQWGGARKKAAGRLLDGRTWDELPTSPSVEGRA